MGFYLAPTILVCIATLIAQSSGQLRQTKIFSENEQMEISCPPSDGINIWSATWISAESMSRSRPPYLKASGSYDGQYEGNCYWDQSEAVKSLCETYELCRFTPSKMLFGDCGYRMRLSVTYSCSYCESFDIYNSRKKRSDDFLTQGGFQVQCQRVRRKNHVATASGSGPSTSGGYGSSSGGSEGVCPNQRFVDKHILSGYTDSIAAAENFAKNAHTGRQTYGRVHTETNTVYFVQRGVPMEYEETSGKRHCRFMRTATKYVCNYDKSGTVWKWVCENEGQVYATHNKGTGHLIGDSGSRW